MACCNVLYMASLRKYQQLSAACCIYMTKCHDICSTMCTIVHHAES